MKPSPPLRFTFINPNTPAAFEALLKKILPEKLAAEIASRESLPPSESSGSSISCLSDFHRKESAS